jgi:hypothetical protein
MKCFSSGGRERIHVPVQRLLLHHDSVHRASNGGSIYVEVRTTYIPRTADVSVVPVADAPLTLPIATVRKHLAANQMPSELQIFKADDRRNKRHAEMKTYPHYTDILLHNGHFLP